MIRNLFFITTLYIFSLAVSAQQIDGTYINGVDSIVFSNNNVSFRISGFAGLSTTQVGEGTYEVFDNFLLVNTQEYTGDKTTFKELEGSKTDTTVVKVVGLNNYAIQGVLVESKNKSDKTITAGVTGNDGLVLFTNNEKCVKLSASLMGYNSIDFDYNSDKDYLIRLAQNDVIEDKTVVFRFKEVDDETISILLLTDNYNSDKKLESELNKLEKKARKNNRIDKRYKKKFEPYVGIY